jgi:NAD(P)-dependent dehydrogenase (short-subunit alcohol dehydrogenase family)
MSDTSMGKTAIITGGGRGIGRNTALNLLRRGTDVIITYRERGADAESLVAEAGALGRKAAALQLNTGSIAEFDGFVQNVEKVLQGWGRDRFDYLVNNAGVSFHTNIDQTTEEQFDEVMNVHVKGVFFLTQKLLPLMRDGGRIVNISTALTRVASPGSSVYAAAKAAVEVLTRYQAKEFGPRRITANVVAPGAIQTDFSGGIVRDNPQVNKMIADITALGRAGVPDDVGPMIASLLSDDNRWVNAQRIEVSGGMAL